MVENARVQMLNNAEEENVGNYAYIQKTEVCAQS
jgi:hypothetical protein